MKGEVDKLDLPAASFDRIVCTEVLEHTRDPEAILGAIARLLRADGVAVITVPNDPLILRLKALVRRSPVGWVLGDRVEWGGDRYHLHRWTPAEFEACWPVLPRDGSRRRPVRRPADPRLLPLRRALTGGRLSRRAGGLLLAQPVDLSGDVDTLAFQVVRDGGPEAEIADPVQAVRRRRVEATELLELAAGAGLEARQPLGDAVFDRRHSS